MIATALVIGITLFVLILLGSNYEKPVFEPPVKEDYTIP